MAMRVILVVACIALQGQEGKAPRVRTRSALRSTRTRSASHARRSSLLSPCSRIARIDFNRGMILVVSLFSATRNAVLGTMNCQVMPSTPRQYSGMQVLHEHPTTCFVIGILGNP